MTDKKLLSVNELAEKLNVSATWVYARTKNNELPFLRCGRYCRFDFDEVLEYLKKKQRTGIDKP